MNKQHTLTPFRIEELPHPKGDDHNDTNRNLIYIRTLSIDLPTLDTNECISLC